MLYLIFSLLLVDSVYGSSIFHHESGITTCTSRYEYRKEMQSIFPGCSEFIKHNQICGEDLVIAFTEHPPYVWKDDGGQVVGIIPGMIRDAIETCCYNCNNVTFTGPFEPLEKFNQTATIFIPIQSSKTNTRYFGYDFIYMTEVKMVSFIGRAMKHDPNKMVQTIFSAVFNTWPLFLIALAMAAVAGIAVWILDNKWNESEFPNSFPRGPFEGFWWAVVSMTTVGYGDRSPKSTIARIFAVLWIITGITLFSMYTATLTSALTSAVIASHDVSLYQKTVGVLNTTSVGIGASLHINAKYKGYHDTHAIKKAIFNEEVDVVALDENIANHVVDDMIADGSVDDLTLYERIPTSGITYGMVSYNNSWSQLFKSFYDSNDDQRDIMLKQALKFFDENRDHGSILKKSTADASEIFTSMKMFVTCLISLIIIAVILTMIGLFIKWLGVRTKKKNLAVNDNGDGLLMKEMSP